MDPALQTDTLEKTKKLCTGKLGGVLRIPERNGYQNRGSEMINDLHPLVELLCVIVGLLIVKPANDGSLLISDDESGTISLRADTNER
jgi:hypothetical protein